MLPGRSGVGRGRYLDLFWLLLLGTVWGASYLFIKVGVAEVPALTFVMARLVLGAALLWPLVRVVGYPMPRSRPLWEAYLVMGLLSGALPYSLITWGEIHISSGLAALLQATMPLFTVLLAHRWTADERLTLPRVLGVIVGFLGVGLVLFPELRRGFQAGLLGQLAVVASSISYAAAAIFARNRLRGQPPLVSTAGQLTAGAALMLPLSLIVDRPFHLSPSLPAVASWLGLTILGTVLAYAIYYTLLARTSATFVSMVTYVIPVNGLILGALVLGEPLHLTVLGSLALILLGVFLVRR